MGKPFPQYLLSMSLLVFSGTSLAQEQPMIPKPAQAFVDDMVLLPVDCLLMMPVGNNSPYTCYRNEKLVQLQSTKAKYALLDRYNINSPYDVISKQCKPMRHYDRVHLLFACQNNAENWSIEFQYFAQNHPALNVIYLHSVSLKTCASSSAADSLNAVARKFGKPTQVDSDEEGMLYQAPYDGERFTVLHRQTYPDVAKTQKRILGNEDFSCPGNFHLTLKIESKQFHSGRARVIEKIQAQQSKDAKPKF